MNAFDRQLSAHLEEELGATHFSVEDPETERERMALAHRGGVAKYEQRIADTKKKMKLDVAKLEADRKAEKQRHEAEMSILAERIAEARDKANRDTAADARLVASCKAALAELVRE